MKKILILLLCMSFPALPAFAEYKKDECVLIKGNNIIRGMCKSDRFYSKGFDAGVIFKGEKYTITVIDCSNYRIGACKIISLSRDADPSLKTDAIEQYRNDNLEVTKSIEAKFHCFKRKKSTKNPYELCILN